MKYRLLQAEEWERLAEIIDPQFIPHSNTATAAIAEDEAGKITGVLFLQIALHMEPLVLTSPAISFERLHGVLMDAIKNDKGTHFYVFSDKEIVDRMAEFVGMKPTPYRVYEGEVV